MTNDNAAVIAEFRARGRVGGELEGAPLLLLTTYRREDARPRTVPLVFSDALEGRWLVFAANAGASTDPRWCVDLRHEPAAKIEVAEAGGVSEIWVDAEFLDDQLRWHFYDLQAKRFPRYAEFRERTQRDIPVIALQAARRLVTMPRGEAGR